MEKKRLNPPSIDKIVEYWEVNQCECDLGIDWSEAKGRCWRCSKESKSIEKCHIVPHSLGGSNEPSNFVLLCKRCHREAPNVNDSRGMWDWLISTSTTFYDSFFGMRCQLLFVDMYGRLPFTGDDFKKYDHLELLDISRECIDEFITLKEIVNHFGENINESSMAAAYARAEESLIGVYPKVKKRNLEKRLQEEIAKSLIGAKSPTIKELRKFLKDKG